MHPVFLSLQPAKAQAAHKTLCKRVARLEKSFVRSANRLTARDLSVAIVKRDRLRRLITWQADNA